jgi:hypothetical protein
MKAKRKFSGYLKAGLPRFARKDVLISSSKQHATTLSVSKKIRGEISACERSAAIQLLNSLKIFF